MAGAFLQQFTSVEDVVNRFQGSSARDLKGATVHIAWYGYGSYCGSAFVLYERNGVLCEVNGSHCSCFGLEGQWKPERTSWIALRRILEQGTKFDGGYAGEDSAEARLRAVVEKMSGGLLATVEGPRAIRVKRSVSVVPIEPGARKMRLGRIEEGEGT